MRGSEWIDPEPDKAIVKELELLAKGKPVDSSVFEPLAEVEK